MSDNDTGINDQEPAVLTIGHSRRPIDEFVRMLRAHGVLRLVDVRAVPRSRHNPQFESNALKASLAADGIEYIHVKALGGLRRPRPDSINAAWKNTSFRGYADYMQTPEFDAALERLVELAGEKRTAIMCAEAVPWRCHRSLVADALVAREIPVGHILSETRRDLHRLTGFAKRTGIRVTYPPENVQPQCSRLTIRMTTQRSIKLVAAEILALVALIGGQSNATDDAMIEQSEKPPCLG